MAVMRRAAQMRAQKILFDFTELRFFRFVKLFDRIWRLSWLWWTAAVISFTCRLEAFSKFDDNLSVAVWADTAWCNALNLLNSCMDDTAFIRIHRFKHNASAAAKNVCGIFACNVAECFLTFFTVVTDIDCNSLITVCVLVDNKADKILESVKSFAAAADDDAVIVTLNFKEKCVVLLFWGYFSTLNLESFKYGWKIVACFLNDFVAEEFSRLFAFSFLGLCLLFGFIFFRLFYSLFLFFFWGKAITSSLTSASAGAASKSIAILVASSTDAASPIASFIKFHTSSV